MDNMLQGHEARLEVTWQGEHGTVDGAIPFDWTDDVILATVQEALQGGDVQGITTQGGDIGDFVVERFTANNEVPYNRIMVRPKVTLGTCPESVTIDGTVYFRRLEGPRVVLVIDRGWIFAGDVEETDRQVILTRAVLVDRWSAVGFDGVIDNPKSDKITLKRMSAPVVVPKASEIFRVPVPRDWGL